MNLCGPVVSCGPCQGNDTGRVWNKDLIQSFKILEDFFEEFLRRDYKQKLGQKYSWSISIKDNS